MKRYIVTGGAGFIGSSLSHRLIQRGAEVYVIDDLSTGLKRNLPKGAVFFKADISRYGDLAKLKLPSRVDAVFHLAAQSSGEASFDDPARDIEVNYKGTFNVLRLAQAAGCRRFIYSSSMSVYGEAGRGASKVAETRQCHPVSYYGCNKLASERMITLFGKDNGIAPTIFRLFSVYGPGQNMLNMKQGIVSIYLSYLLRGKPIHVKGSLDRFRDLIYIDDVVDLLEGCEGRKDAYYETFNAGTGIGTTVHELLRTLLAAYGKDDFAKWTRCKGNTPGDVKGCVADIGKAKRILRWKPKHNLRDGIGKMKDWLDRTKDLWTKE